jgi:CO/xanthine dehydrogenase Mo-binding subunit
MLVEGVAAILTAEDLPAFAAQNRRRLLLARDRVVFAGQPVALILAENEAAAQDAAEMVLVDYEPLTAAITIDEAMAEDAPLVWPGGVPSDSDEAGAHGADLGVGEKKQQLSNVAGRRKFQRGDIEAGFAEADVVVERSVTTSMVHQSYIEPHATVVQPDPLTGGMTVWTSTQGPFWAREEVAGILDVPESDVRVIGTTVGGGFGGKFVLYEPLLALAAKKLNRPVKLVMTRMEEMLAGNPAPSSRMTVKLGARKDGTFTALSADMAFECGCYPGFHGIAAFLLGSYYPVPNLDIRYVEVLNFKPSVGAYRAPGTPQATFALESVIDELAGQLGIDPFELRLNNAAEGGDLRADGKPWQPMGMKQVLEALQAHPAWQNREAARAAGRGVGFAIGGWPGGTEPAAAACMLNRDGELHVHIGSVDLNGTSTGFALVAAEVFGIDPEKVRVVLGDTASAPYAGAAGGSKITYTVGPAIIQAVQEAKQQVFEIASEEF